MFAPFSGLGSTFAPLRRRWPALLVGVLLLTVVCGTTPAFSAGRGGTTAHYYTRIGGAGASPAVAAAENSVW